MAASAAVKRREIEDARSQIQRWIDAGPALFAVEVLGVPAEWDEAKKEGVLPWQWKASAAVAKSKRLSIRAGKGVGKSAFLAWTVLWFLACFFPCKGACTAPTATQMSDVLWAELATWHRRMFEVSPEFAAKFEWTTDEFRNAEAPNQAFVVARTARAEKPEALQGIHSKYTLVIADEAPGVADAIFDAGRGALSGEHSYVVLAGNPNRTNGLFYETHHKLKPLWETLHVNGEEVPLQTQKFRDDIIYEYGKDSNYYRVNVTGEFPFSEDDVVVPMYLCNDALIREVKAFGATVWGIDVARFGSDRTVLVKRCENATLEPHKSWNGMDLMQTCGRIMHEWQETLPEHRPQTILVDVIGIGAGVADRLLELNLPVSGVNVAESASVSDMYMRLRDELWFSARKWLEKKNCKLVSDDVLCAELSLPKYQFTSGGKIKVEGKDELKKRYPRSPDVADAFCLTFAHHAIAAGRNSFEPQAYSD